MSEKIIITTFTDPMMGLSWECEPIFRKLETHFAWQIEFHTVMALLVRNVRDFMTPDELALPPAEGIRRYNARLAKIYESEEPISGMPINMTDFHLFSEEQPSSLPLNLAYHAARLTEAGKADLFLYNQRYATVVDCHPTTEMDELVNVAKVLPLKIRHLLFDGFLAPKIMEKEHLKIRKPLILLELSVLSQLYPMGTAARVCLWQAASRSRWYSSTWATPTIPPRRTSTPT